MSLSETGPTIDLQEGATVTLEHARISLALHVLRIVEGAPMLLILHGLGRSAELEVPADAGEWPARPEPRRDLYRQVEERAAQFRAFPSQLLARASRARRSAVPAAMTSRSSGKSQAAIMADRVMSYPTNRCCKSLRQT